MIQELALTEVDDSANPDSSKTLETEELLNSIANNIEILEEDVAAEQENSEKNGAGGQVATANMQNIRLLSN